MTNTEQPGKSDVLADRANNYINVGFAELLGLEFTGISAERVTAQLTITPKLLQPYGIVHGGVYCAIIETLASVGGAYWYGRKGTVVGVNNNTDFLRSVGEGTVHAEATPIHRGRSQQLWVVTIADADGRPLARGQVRLANLENKTGA